MSKTENPQFLSAPAYAGQAAHKIAYRLNTGRKPGLVWCGGLKSDMEGTKAQAVHDWAEKNGHAYVRFDYFGHGASSGEFKDGTITRWTEDTLQVIDELTDGPQILIGSSMGGWTSMKAALARPDRVKALLLIAPAPDFSEKLMWAGYSEAVRQTILDKGIYYEPSDYGDPYEITRNFILDGRKNQILDTPVKFIGPVRILQGMQDKAVPWEYALKVQAAFAGNDVTLTLVKDGDHSLSRPQDIERLLKTLETFI
jgi:pimeloyl-ACP methyl ester carboxylesterase